MFFFPVGVKVLAKVSQGNALLFSKVCHQIFLIMILLFKYLHLPNGGFIGFYFFYKNGIVADVPVSFLSINKSVQKDQFQGKAQNSSRKSYGLPCIPQGHN